MTPAVPSSSSSSSSSSSFSHNLPRRLELSSPMESLAQQYDKEMQDVQNYILAQMAQPEEACYALGLAEPRSKINYGAIRLSFRRNGVENECAAIALDYPEFGSPSTSAYSSPSGSPSSCSEADDHDMLEQFLDEVDPMLFASD